jgi:hypothetical protein
MEVKTIRPENKDAWDRYEKHRKLFSSDTDVALQKDWLGGEIYHHMLAARSKFLDYNIDLEAKLREMEYDERLPARLCFCGDGFQWHEDELEDFADFYRRGKHRQDDHFAVMEMHTVSTEKIELDRSISGFSLVMRRPTATRHGRWRWEVRGPEFAS